ncbi:sensor histidine kinase [Pseudochryseolinea flava]|uniref:histidine kinase n=1 Tax=Pseudochryseolinea flava TaxID=2059302 RepID=A0A364Y2E8_9BACT|nr:HAMP domain-containing sensor histidine kinase [Pseudochryseolinea flava]RAW00950.1 hypothetical protein DQQ10_11970 [Pseudochryseolinea flava]
MSIQLGQWTIDKLTLNRVLDFLPYPFLISERRENTIHNIFVNKKFVEEIGYNIEEMETIHDWFRVAYPDPEYRRKIFEEWKQLVETATEKDQSIYIRALIQTKKHGKKWYEVKSSFSENIRLVAFVSIHDEMLKEEELLRINENKNRTLAILSHDLRGPITNLHALSQLALNKHLTQEEFLATVQNVQEKTFQVLEFLDTTLHWTRTNFDNITLCFDPIDLHAVIHKILRVYENSYSLKNLKVSTNLADYPPIASDHEIVVIVLRNLISNAIKFTPDGGTMVVHTGTENGQAFLAVEDTGMGMSELVINKIFSEELQSQNGTRQEKGLGIGLRLCGELLKKIGAAISMKSEIGKGTCAKILFPKKK